MTPDGDRTLSRCWLGVIADGDGWMYQKREGGIGLTDGCGVLPIGAAVLVLTYLKGVLLLVCGNKVF